MKASERIEKAHELLKELFVDRTGINVSDIYESAGGQILEFDLVLTESLYYNELQVVMGALDAFNLIGYIRTGSLFKDGCPRFNIYTPISKEA